MHYVGDTCHINRIARVTGIDIVDTATQRKDGDAGEGRGSGLLYNHAQGNCCARFVVICSNQVGISVVIVIAGIDSICEPKATYDRLGSYDLVIWVCTALSIAAAGALAQAVYRSARGHQPTSATVPMKGDLAR